MHKESHKRLIGTGLRALTLGSKFLLVFFLAKFIPADQLGSYGLVAATVGYGIYLVGLEFYTFASRELVGAAPAAQATIVANQCYLYLLCYALAIPVVLLLSWRGLLPGAHAAWIVGLLIAEHIAQEANRVLIALSQQLFAGVVLFVRMGAWGLIVIGVQALAPHTRTLDFVLGAWLAGVVLACGLSLWRIGALVPLAAGPAPDRRWIGRGLRVAFPLLLASIALRGISTFDRYFVEHLAGLEVLGAYVLYAGMAAAVISFLDAAVVDFAYPKLIAAGRARDAALLRAELLLVGRNVLVFGALLSLACALTGTVFVGYLANPVYADNIFILYWLLLATAISACGAVPHLGLYALGVDRHILYSQGCGFLVFLLVYLAWPAGGVLPVVLALCAGNAVLLGWKTLVFRSRYRALAATASV
ncbi:lipopolysaccharide biosynthesis protein [Massilia glaciei]|uniref:Flippase n=1 Tax=Massilia glaciei TaxID=1524097 RepID=A0A2U2HN46_9BURK|nr:flippase [Massilia glaciei]PWF48930.1 flippase [Massilia glaciei]